MSEQIEQQPNASPIRQTFDTDETREQALADGMEEQRATQPPAESFGSFGSPQSTDIPGVPALPDPYVAAPVITAPGNSAMPLTSGNMPMPAPGNALASQVSNTPLPAPGYPYMPGYPYPLVPGAASYAAFAKKPIYFPLTRNAPPLLQIFGMLLYSLVVALCIMVCVLTMLKISLTNASLYVYPNGSVNGLSILLTIVLILLIVPACSAFSGALFGSWRGLLVSLFAVAGGVVFAHLTDDRFGNPNAYQGYLALASLPVSALITGLIYDRRKYAAWWKSMFTMLLGMAIPVFWLAALIFISEATSLDLSTLAAKAHVGSRDFLVVTAISLGFLACIATPILGLFVAGIEGIVHSIIARMHRAI